MSGCWPVEAEREGWWPRCRVRADRAAEKGQRLVLIQGRVAAWTWGECVAPSFPEPLCPPCCSPWRSCAGCGVGFVEPHQACDLRQHNQDPAQPWFLI